MIRRILSLLAVAILGLWLPSQAFAADPEPFTRLVEITADAGTIAATVSPIPVLITNDAETSGIIRVDNTSSLDEDIKIRVADYSIDAAGTPVAAPPDFAFGSATWYRFETADFSLASGTSRDIPFTLVIPAGAGAGDHFASLNVIIEARPGQAPMAPEGASARSVLVIQSRLQHRIAGAYPQTPTVGLSGTNTGGAVDFTARVSNAGNTVVGHQADPTPTLALYNLMPWGDAARPEQTINIGGFYVAPESIRNVAIRWTDSPLFGEYRAVFTLPAADGQPRVTAETILTVINLPVLIGITIGMVIALALATWWLLRLRRVARERQRVVSRPRHLSAGDEGRV
jgi:hypothetical protein